MKINNKQLIYVVDDDKALNTMICKFLKQEGFRNVEGFYSGEEMLQKLSKDTKPIIIQDFDLPGMNGVEVLKKVKPEYPNAEFIFLSGQSNIEVAVNAIKYGAFDYIVKDNFAKENASTKIKNLIKLKTVMTEKVAFKVGLFVFLALLLITWTLFFAMYVM